MKRKAFLLTSFDRSRINMWVVFDTTISVTILLWEILRRCWEGLEPPRMLSGMNVFTCREEQRSCDSCFCAEAPRSLPVSIRKVQLQVDVVPDCPVWKVRQLSCPEWFLVKSRPIIWDLCLLHLFIVCQSLCIGFREKPIHIWNKIDLLCQIREKVESGWWYEPSLSPLTEIRKWRHWVGCSTERRELLPSPACLPIAWRAFAVSVQRP